MAEIQIQGGIADPAVGYRECLGETYPEGVAFSRPVLLKTGSFSYETEGKSKGIAVPKVPIAVVLLSQLLGHIGVIKIFRVVGKGQRSLGTIIEAKRIKGRNSGSGYFPGDQSVSVAEVVIKSRIQIGIGRIIEHGVLISVGHILKASFLVEIGEGVGPEGSNLIGCKGKGMIAENI
jgi:hypothetical protein